MYTPRAFALDDLPELLGSHEGPCADPESQAQDGGCEKVANKDQQVICMASSKKEIKICDGMSSTNGVFFCQAVSTGNSYPCEKIVGNRSHCLALVRDKQRRD